MDLCCHKKLFRIYCLKDIRKQIQKDSQMILFYQVSCMFRKRSFLSEVKSEVVLYMCGTFGFRQGGHLFLPQTEFAVNLGIIKCGKPFAYEIVHSRNTFRRQYSFEITEYIHRF